MGYRARAQRVQRQIVERLHEAGYPGSGLSIVKKGVEKMGGTVGLQSHPGKGSRFWIELERAGQPHALASSA